MVEVVTSPGEPQVRQSIEHGLEREHLFEARQAGAGAVVLAERERHVPSCVRPVEVDVGRTGEDALVTVGAGVAQVHRRAGGNRHAGEHDILGDRPPQPLRGRLEAEDLLDEIRDAGTIGGDAFEESRLAQQDPQPGGHRERRGLVATDEQVVDDRDDLLIAERPRSGERGAGQVRDDVLARVRSLRVDRRFQVLVELDHLLGDPHLLLRFEPAHEGQDPRRAPRPQPVEIRAREPEEVADHHAGKAGGELGDPFDVPVLFERGEQLVDRLLDERSPLVEARAAEVLIDERAVVTVDGWVRAERCHPLPAATFVHLLGGQRSSAARTRGEHRLVAEHVHDVVVPADDEVGSARDAVHRLLVAKVLIGGVPVLLRRETEQIDVHRAEHTKRLVSLFVLVIVAHITVAGGV